MEMLHRALIWQIWGTSQVLSSKMSMVTVAFSNMFFLHSLLPFIRSHILLLWIDKLWYYLPKLLLVLDLGILVVSFVVFSTGMYILFLVD